MIVDDDATIQMELEEYLTYLGHTVVGIADTGGKAVQMARETKPDLILMDITLTEEMDGISAAREIKEEVDAAVVFVTGFGDPEYIERAKMVEPFGYVMKPFDEKEINGNIEIALHKRKLDLELKKANEQLEQTNRGLKQEIKEHRRTKKALQESNEKYSHLLNHVPAGIFEIDFIKQKFVHVNDTMCERTGYTREEILSMSPFDILAEDSKRLFRERLSKIIAGETVPTSVEFRAHGKDDREFWILLDSNVLYENGKPKGATVVVHDITERKAVEEALQESEERFRLTFNTCPDAVNINQFETGLYVDINDGFTQLTGYTREDVIGRTSGESNIWHDPGDRQKLIHGLREKGSCENLEAQFRRKDGSLTTALMSAIIINLKGTPHIISIIRDISDIKVAEEEKQKLQAQIQQVRKMEAIATLAGGIAHEFNNALMGIVGNIELLKMDLPDDERRDRYFGAMKDSSHRMSRLTDQLLAYAKGGKYQPNDLKCDDFMIQTLPILQHSLKPAIRVETHFPKDISYIKADHAQMQMVLSALLDNSNEAMEDEGLLKITAENKDVDEAPTKQHPGLKPGRYVCFTIEDDGKGMDEETRSGIFEPFFTTKFQGRGMGMAAVYGIVKNHNGYIYVDSELGKGTVVQIYLPAIEIEVEKPKKAEVVTGSGTILMVEDEDVVIEATQAMLEMLGYRVMVAKTGKDAIHVAETFDDQIDLALLDIKLPDMEGGKVYSHIMKARPNLKVIVSTGYAIEGPARKILDAGAQDFIQKPFSLVTLSEKLKGVLEGR